MSYDTWVRKPLGELSQIRRGSSPRPIVKYMAETGMPWVKIADATESNSRYIEKTNQFIKFEGVPRSVIVEPGELILSNSGTAGLPKFMGIKACIHDGWQVLRDFKDIDKSFLYYELLFIRSKLLHGAYDSSMKNLTLDMVRNFEIDLPPLQEQKAIANILSSLDDKIELNNKINKNLEELAQTLYKHWFVDFEFPNEYGEPYKSSGGEMVESELGLIPARWEIVNYKNVFTYQNGFAFKSKDYSEKGLYKIITIKNVKDGFFDLSTTSKINKKPEKLNENHVLKIGDILMSLTGNVGRVCLVDEEKCLLNQRVIKIETENIIEGFVYVLLRNVDNASKIISLGKGSAQQNLSPVEMSNLTTVFSKEINDKLFYPFNNIIDQIIRNNIESKTLAETRDLLLPKLMSGEIRVPIKE